MSTRFMRSVVVMLCLSGALLGCTGEAEPSRLVQMVGGQLDMAISDAWELESQTPAERVYFHKEIANLKLRIVSTSVDMGQPLRTGQVKSVVGQELNRKYGGVISRMSLGGNAMLKYSRTVEDEYGDELHSEEWVIAKPVGHSHVQRIAISLHIPTDAASDPATATLIEGLDRQVGDARIPRA